MNLFFSVGEPSGDIHGANLIRALKAKYTRPEPLHCVGFGGPRMAEAGGELHFDLTSLAVMWVARVLWNIRTFFRLADEAEAYFRDHQPDAVILIDYPGFNWHIARRAKKYGIPVYYYSPPQVWAWRSSRVKKLRELTDMIFSGLPFETDWLSANGCKVMYVGHPFFDETDLAPFPAAIMSGEKNSAKKIVALLPGSRTQEVKANFPAFLKVISYVRAAVPEISFIVAPFREHHAEMIREMICRNSEAKIFYEAGGIHILPGQAAEVIRAADCCLSVSGSVSLELLEAEKPSVITYRISRLAWWLQWYFRRVKYITLVNLLAAKNPFRNYNREYAPGCADAKEIIFPEYLSCLDRSRWMADDLIRWLTDENAYAATVARLRELKTRVAQSGAAEKAAEFILSERVRE